MKEHVNEIIRYFKKEAIVASFGLRKDVLVYRFFNEINNLLLQ